MLISLRWARFPPMGRKVNRSAVSGLTTTRASVCDAFLRSLPVSVEIKSSASMYPSSVVLTVKPSATLSKEMFARNEIVISVEHWVVFI
jgi:hypothetical protein